MLTPRRRRRLVEGAAAWGVALDSGQVEQFDRYSEMLEEANRIHNLTRIPPEQYVDLHFLDSLALAAAVAPQEGQSLLDVGSGAGLPGLALAIAFPRLHVTLLDATRKRMEFVETVLREIERTDVHAIHGRAEEMSRQTAYREAYDIVTARAVARLPGLVGWLAPFVKVGGLAVAYKSASADAEIDASRAAVKAVGGEIERVVEVPLPGTDISRRLVLIRKRRSVAASAPRAAASRKSDGT